MAYSLPPTSSLRGPEKALEIDDGSPVSISCLSLVSRFPWFLLLAALPNIFYHYIVYPRPPPPNTETAFIGEVLGTDINLGRTDIFIMSNLYVVSLSKCVWCISAFFFFF